MKTSPVEFTFLFIQTPYLADLSISGLCLSFHKDFRVLLCELKVCLNSPRIMMLEVPPSPTDYNLKEKRS